MNKQSLLKAFLILLFLVGQASVKSTIFSDHQKVANILEELPWIKESCSSPNFYKINIKNMPRNLLVKLIQQIIDKSKEEEEDVIKKINIFNSEKNTPRLKSIQNYSEEKLTVIICLQILFPRINNDPELKEWIIFKSKLELDANQKFTELAVFGGAFIILSGVIFIILDTSRRLISKKFFKPKASQND